MTGFDLAILGSALILVVSAMAMALVSIWKLSQQHDRRIADLTAALISRNTWEYQALKTSSSPSAGQEKQPAEEDLEDESDYVPLIEMDETDIRLMMQAREAEEAA